MQHIAPFRVMEILARAKALEAQGHDVVHLEVGEPDFPAPQAVVDAAHQALASGQTRYTPAAGIGVLRQAVADHYARRFGLSLDPGRVVITPGASGALQLVLGVLLDQGDEVLVQDPGYPCNRHMIQLYGGTAKALPAMAAGFDTAQVLASFGGGGRAMMLASPANPTGEVIEPADLARVYAGMDPERQALIVDEIYQGLEYHDAPSASALSLGGNGLFVINSFSKYFGMTGFRVGWVVAPQEFVEPIERLAQNLFLAPPTIAQHAALAVFDQPVEEELERRRWEFGKRRDLLYQGLDELGFALPGKMPGGAFYVYAGLNGLADSGEQFANDLLREAHVAITPGIDFGSQGTVDHVRFAYTTSEERIETGLRRIERFLNAGG